MGGKWVCVNTYLNFRGGNSVYTNFSGGKWVWGKMSIAEYILIFPGGNWVWGKNEYATPEHLWNFNGYSHSLVHPEIIFPSRFSLSKNNFWDYETQIVRDYDRHWLNKTMRHWLYETMRDTDCTRLWETLIVRDYEIHWLYEIYDLMGNRSKL